MVPSFDKIIRVYVFKSGLIGDIVVAIPSLVEIRKLFPNAKIIFYVEYQRNGAHLLMKEILLKYNLVDGYKVFDVKSISGLFRIFCKFIFKNRYLSIIYSLERYSWTDRRERFFKLLNFRFVYGPAALKNKSSLADFVGIQLLKVVELATSKRNTIQKPSFSYPKLPELFNESSDLVSFPELRFQGEYAVVCIWSNMSSKRWEPINFIKVIDYLKRKYFKNVVLIGGGDPNELKENNFVAERTGAINLSGKLSLLNSFKLIQKSRIFLGNDSGTLHLANLAQIPSVSIFSSIEKFGIWRPVVSKSISLRADVACSGCELRDCIQTSFHCTNLIDVDKVKIEIDILLNPLHE